MVNNLARNNAERELGEVVVEWVAAVRAATGLAETLTKLVGGYFPVEKPGTSDRRWHGQEPDQPALRVVGGEAGIWSQPLVKGSRQWGEKLLPLPELGTGMELTARLVAAWYAGSNCVADIWRRASDLELGFADICRKVNVSEYPDRGPGAVKLHITWTGTPTCVGVVVGGPIVVWDAYSCVPDGEGRLGDEEYPEIDRAYAVWSAAYMARNHSDEGDTRVHAGVVFVRGFRTPIGKEESEDGMSRRQYGGEDVLSVMVGDHHIATVSYSDWKQIEEILGLKVGEVATVSRRQICAVEAAFYRGFVFGALGPRGRAAMLALAKAGG